MDRERTCLFIPSPLRLLHTLPYRGTRASNPDILDAPNATLSIKITPSLDSHTVSSNSIDNAIHRPVDDWQPSHPQACTMQAGEGQVGELVAMASGVLPLSCCVAVRSMGGKGGKGSVR